MSKLIPHTPEKFVEQLQDLFELKQEQIIDAPFVLDQQALKNLIAMTPYAYKASPERRLQLEQQLQLEVTASFQIYVFQKRNKKSHLMMAFLLFNLINQIF